MDSSRGLGQGKACRCSLCFFVFVCVNSKFIEAKVLTSPQPPTRHSSPRSKVRFRWIWMKCLRSYWGFVASDLDWGYPKSPWVSTLKWSKDLDDLIWGYPYFRKGPSKNNAAGTAMVLEYCKGSTLLRALGLWSHGWLVVSVDHFGSFDCWLLRICQATRGPNWHRLDTCKCWCLKCFTVG